MPSVHRKVAGAQDHTSVCLVETSNMTTSVSRTVVTYLGKFYVLTVCFRLLINIFHCLHADYTRLATKHALRVILSATVVVTDPVLNTAPNAAIFATVCIVCPSVR